MCNLCNKDSLQDYVIESRNSKLVICPECAYRKIANDALRIPFGDYKSELSNYKNAVRLTDKREKEEFYLLPSEAIRLIGKMLLPDEVRALNKTHPKSRELTYEFYYSRSSEARQPKNKRDYQFFLKEYRQYHQSV